MNVKLKCKCGAVEGVATGATAQSGNRVVCCCDDCQRFAAHLNGESEILDEFGGTDIYQTSQSQVTMSAGAEHLRCIRLSEKGLTRWYTDCCNTPVGNTVSARIPFVGLIHSFMDTEHRTEHGTKHGRDETLGPVRAYVQVQHAIGEPDYPHSAQKFPLGITLRIIRKMLMWKLTGMSKPSAFYDESGQARSKPTVIG